jgi:hypothetical protein
MIDEVSGLRAQVSFRTDDNGEEFLWAEPVRPGTFRVLSVGVPDRALRLRVD